MNPLKIKRLKHLATLLGVSIAWFDEITAKLDRQESFPFGNCPQEFAVYREKEKVVKGKSRKFAYCDGPLCRVQKEILRRLQNVNPSSAFHGAVKGRSARSNACRHTHKKYVEKLDIRDFFPSVRPELVYVCFARDLECSKKVARTLTRLTTFRGHIHQGLPTSPLISVIVLDRLIRRAEKHMRDRGISFTVYIDDLTLSSNKKVTVARRWLVKLIEVHGQKIKPEKTKIFGPRDEPVVTGFATKNGIDAPAEKVREVEDAIVEVGQMCITGGVLDSKRVQSIRGKINYIRTGNQSCAQMLTRKLDQVLASTSQFRFIRTG